MKFKKIIFILTLSLIILISGCSIENLNENIHKDSNQIINEEIGPDINSVLNKKIKFYYREILDSNITCVSGDCPNKKFKTPLKKKIVFFVKIIVRYLKINY